MGDADTSGADEVGAATGVALAAGAAGCDVVATRFVPVGRFTR